MILSWCKAEMPADADTLDCEKVAVCVFDEFGNRIPLAWVNLATGEYFTRIRHADGTPFVFEGRYQYQQHRTEPELLRWFLKAKDGTPVHEVSLDYVVSLATLLKGNDGSQRIELVGSGA